MEKASYGYGTLWTIKPHLREAKSGKISPVKGFQQKRLRFKPGQRVTRTDRSFHVGGEVLGAKELTARVKWDAGHTTEEPYKNLKLAKARTEGKQNYERLGTMNKADKEKNRLYIISKGTGITFKHGGKIRTFSRSGENLPNGDIPGRVGRQEGTLKVTGEGFKFTPGERKQQWTQQRQGKMVQMHRLKIMGGEQRIFTYPGADKGSKPEVKIMGGEQRIFKYPGADKERMSKAGEGEFYVILQKSQVQVKPYMRAGHAVAGYSAARAKAEMKRQQSISHADANAVLGSPLSPYEMGRDAFKAGKNAVPAQDKAFVDAHIAGSGKKPGDAIKVLDEWIRGWHEANVAEPVDFTEKDEEEYYDEVSKIRGDVGEIQKPYGKLVDIIRPGDRVTIVDRFGKERTGRAVMRGPAGWVLNMGGAHGTPAIASDNNVTRVKSMGKKSTPWGIGESQEPYGRKLTTWDSWDAEHPRGEGIVEPPPEMTATRKLTFDSGKKLRSRDKVAKQIEENLTKPVKFLKPETKKSVNNQLRALGTYHDLIPMKGIDDALEHHGLKILQEDNTEWSGFLLGDSSHTSFPVAVIGSAQSKGVVGAGTGKEWLSYEPVKNALLNLSWYKLDTGRYEILAYIS